MTFKKEPAKPAKDEFDFDDGLLENPKSKPDIDSKKIAPGTKKNQFDDFDDVKLSKSNLE